MVCGRLFGVALCCAMTDVMCAPRKRNSCPNKSASIEASAECCVLCAGDCVLMFRFKSTRRHGGGRCHTTARFQVHMQRVSQQPLFSHAKVFFFVLKIDHKLSEDFADFKKSGIYLLKALKIALPRTQSAYGV